MEYSDDAHGVLILNSNAMEVETGPGPHLVYRTIGGQIDLAFFPGPKPEEVIQQYLAYIGTPFLPAYWALGFQVLARMRGNRIGASMAHFWGKRASFAFFRCKSSIILGIL